MRLRHGFTTFDRGQRVAFAAAGTAGPARIVGQPGLPTDASLPISVEPFAGFARPEGLEASPGRAPGAVPARFVWWARCESEWMDRVDRCRQRHEFVQDRVGRRNLTRPPEFLVRIQKIAFAPCGWRSVAQNPESRPQASALDDFRQQPRCGARGVGLCRIGAPACGQSDRVTRPGDKRIKRRLGQSWRPCDRGFRPASRASSGSPKGWT